MKINVQKKLHKAFLEAFRENGRIIVGCFLIMGPFIEACSTLPALKGFVYHTGIFPYGGVVDGWVVTTLAGIVSFVSAAVAATLLDWLLQSKEGKAEKKTLFLFSHDRGRRRLSREGGAYVYGLSGFHALYLLIFSFRSFWKDGPLTTALEDVCAGYVLSALVVSGGFVLVLALSKVLVKVPQLEFQTLGGDYFLYYYSAFWGVLLVTAISGPFSLGSRLT